MTLVKRVAVMIGVLSVAVPATSWACLPGLFCGMPFGHCICPPCVTCHLPPPSCICVVPVVPVIPVVPVQTTLRPVVQTQYRQEQVVTYRDVPTIQHRREAFIEQVPVTAYERVTETVYVPQQVTKMVPRTVLQPQTRYRDVAYQVNQRVAETQTRLVPQQTVSYVPEVRQAASCAGSFGPTSYIPPAAPAAAIPTMPPITVSPGRVSENPAFTPGRVSENPAYTPVPQYPDVPTTNTSWQTIAPRAQSNLAPPSPARGAFRPAPSAAAVWQSRFE